MDVPGDAVVEQAGPGVLTDALDSEQVAECLALLHSDGGVLRGDRPEVEHILAGFGGQVHPVAVAIIPHNLTLRTRVRFALCRITNQLLISSAGALHEFLVADTINLYETQFVGTFAAHLAIDVFHQSPSYTLVSAGFCTISRPALVFVHHQPGVCSCVAMIPIGFAVTPAPGERTPTVIVIHDQLLPFRTVAPGVEGIAAEGGVVWNLVLLQTLPHSGQVDSQTVSTSVLPHLLVQGIVAPSRRTLITY